MARCGAGRPSVLTTFICHFLSPTFFVVQSIFYPRLDILTPTTVVSALTVEPLEHDIRR